MRGNNVLGIIFSSIGENFIRELTEQRTMASVPFGGRYRLIDFPLSNMVNSGINKVAVITKSNYQSLMNHLGSGKSWDLSRKRDGLFIFPPFGNSNKDFKSRISMLSAIINFIKNSKEEYVLLSDCNTICNIDFRKVLDEHVKNKADITLIYRKDVILKKVDTLTLNLRANKRVEEIKIQPKDVGTCNVYMNMSIINKDLLIHFISKCISENKCDYNRDVLIANVSNFRFFAYEFKGFSRDIMSLGSFFEANMLLMNNEIRNELFSRDVPIYTKVRDDMPTRYGESSNVKNSLIGNGCVIDGNVENSIIFKGVKIGKGTKVSNCIIMQDTSIGTDCKLSYIIADKDIKINNERILMGFRSYPVYISKASVV